jgi:hypothetical protein
VPPYKPVIMLPAQEPEVITPLLTITPDKLDGKELVRYKLPPMPTPPATINAPVVEDVEDVEAVIATPDTDNILVDGLNDNVVLEDNATPEPVAVDPKITGCAKLFVALTTFIFAAVVAKPEVVAYPD